MPSYKVKDVHDWQPGEDGDVLAFLKDTVPGHPCHVFFKYTTGHVLAALTKDDLRRQARDVEAGNVIWVQLENFRKLIKQRNTIADSYPSCFTIFVRTPADVAIEMEVSPMETTWQLKERLATAEGTKVECQRLVFNGQSLKDDSTLASYKVGSGSVVLLIPRLSSAVRCIPTTTPRGQLMVPGNRPWQPSHSIRPYVPIVASDLYRPFPMNIEFDRIEDYRQFMQTMGSHARNNDLEMDAANEAVLEILPLDPNHAPVQTKVHLGGDSDMLRVDSVGDIVVPNSRYKALLKSPGQQGIAGASSLGLVLTTGSRIF